MFLDKWGLASSASMNLKHSLTRHASTRKGTGLIPTCDHLCMSSPTLSLSPLHKLAFLSIKGNKNPQK